MKWQCNAQRCQKLVFFKPILQYLNLKSSTTLKRKWGDRSDHVEVYRVSSNSRNKMLF